MKKSNALLAIVILLLFSFFSIAYAAGAEPKEAKKIDLKLTADYFKGLENRAKFPDTVTLAYYYAYSISALGETITPAIKEKLIDFIKRCQKVNGGFASEPTYSKTANVIFTYYALKSLAFLESLDAIDKEKAKSFVLGLVQEDGGFAASNQKGQRTTLPMTAYGVRSVQILGALEKLDKQKTIQFINGYTREDGKGFNMMQKGWGASPQATNMAVKALDILGGLTDSTKTAVLDYLKSTNYSGLIENKKYQGLPQLKHMMEVIQTLDGISALSQVNTAKMYEFVESLYIPSNGGFGPSPGLGTTPPSTYHGIVCLVKLGKLHDPKRKQ